MGLTRKLTSVSTFGMVKYRSNKEKANQLASQRLDFDKEQAALNRQNAPTVTVAPAAADGVTARLTELAGLLDAGTINQAEYDALRAKSLGLA